MASTTNSQNRHKSPASGERRAIRNLSAQYKIAAELALLSLRKGRLDWIRLVDPDVGRLDDVIISQNGQIHAYQIKWSDYRDLVKFTSLVTASTVSGKLYPSPIALMADGWQKLRTTFINRSVVAHFLMHDVPSSRDNRSGRDGHSHLQAFLRYAWPSRGQWFEDDNPAYATWSQHIDEMLTASGLSKDEFPEFIANCEFDLGYDLLESNSREALARRAEVDALALAFMDRVSASTGAVQLGSTEILAALGWADRLEFRFKHDFPVDETLYRPLAGTISKIEEALTAFEKGYVALIGPPGSGKSTTLTHSLRYRNGIELLRYYAFVRNDPRTGRGEAAAFLHDLCLALEDQGAGKSERFLPMPSDLPGLRDKMTRLLDELAENARIKGSRVVLLVDGLDHIEREQSPERSLIEELPAPENLPDGVLIFLGTQPVGLEADAASLHPIRAQLEREPKRKIEVDRLTRSQVRDLYEITVPRNLQRAGDADAVLRLSGGHPLALTYLLKKLAAVESIDAASEIINKAEENGGDVDLDYAAYWDLIAQDAEMRDLLGLVSRVRGTIDLSTISALADTVTIEKFARGAFHFFQELMPARWSFFHNSFRQFLLRKTERDAFGTQRPERNADFHRRLADAAINVPKTDPYHWDRLFHLEKAGERAGLLAEARQELFRAQFLAGRSREDVEEDIDRALTAASAELDIVALARLLLIRKELRDRRSVLDETNHIDLVIGLATDKHAVLMAGENLRVSDAVALRWTTRLEAQGDLFLASRLFDAAEPLDQLSGNQETNLREDGIMEAWARAAWLFRPLKDVIATALQVRADYPHAPGSGDPSEEAEEWTNEFRIELLTSVGNAILAAKNSDRFEEFLSLLPSDDIGDEVRGRLDFAIAREGAADATPPSDPIAAMDRLLMDYPAEELSPRDAAILADIAIRLGFPDAPIDDLLGACPDPLFKSDFRIGDSDPFRSVAPLFAQSRAFAARKHPIDPTIIPEPKKDWDRGRVLVQRLVVIVGTLWGEALATQCVSVSEVTRRLRPLAVFHRRTWDETTRWHDWSTISGIAGELACRALSAAHAHGPDAFEAAIDLFESVWNLPRPAGGAGWPVHLQRKIALCAYRIGGDRTRLLRTLDRLEIPLGAGWELYERAEEYCDRAKAWSQIGEVDRARASLDSLFWESFGISHHKDRQIEDWANWFAMLVDEGGSQQIIEQATEKLLALIGVLYANHRGRGTDDATRIFLGALARVDQKRALSCGLWLLDQGLGVRSTLLCALLVPEIESGDADRVGAALIVAAHIVLPYASYEHELAKAVTAVRNSPLAAEPAVSHGLRRFRQIGLSRGQSGKHYLDERNDEEAVTLPDESEKSDKPEALFVDAAGIEYDHAALNILAGNPAKLTEAIVGAVRFTRTELLPVVDRLFGCPRSSLRSQAIDNLLSNDPSFRVVERIAEHAVTEGDLALAERSVDHLVAGGRPFGWSAHYDGGTRLAAARAMGRIDPVGGRARAMALLLKDMLESNVDLDALIGDLPVHLPLISDCRPAEALWAELDIHLAALVDVERSEFKPIGMFDDQAVPSNTPLTLILRDFDNEAASLAWDARRALIDLLRLGDPDGSAAAALRAKLNGNIREQTAAIATLACLSVDEAELARTFVDDIQRMAWAQSSVIRISAQQTLARLGIEPPPPPPSISVPAFYRLEVPKGRQSKTSLTGSDIDPSKPLPDTSDPYDLSRLYHDELDVLGDMSGYGFDRLVRRFAQLMQSLGPSDLWSSVTEKRLTDFNTNIGLQLNYRRPRSIYSQHAFGLLVSELWDCGAIDHVPAAVEPFILAVDPLTSAFFPEPRPAWINLPDPDVHAAYPVENWTKAVADALPAADTGSDGRIIIAEFTKILNQDSERRTEARLSAIAPSKLRFPCGSGVSLYSFQHRQSYAAEDYPYLKGVGDNAVGLAIAGGSSFAYSRFLAFNPSLALHMGWTVDRSGHFRWVNANGDTMVETLEWAEGNCALHERGSQRSFAGEGYLVLASPIAWAALKREIPTYGRRRMASRRANYEGQSKYAIEIEGDFVTLP